MFSKLMQDVNGNTALMEACQRGHVETAMVLLDHGAIVDQQNKVKEILIIHVLASSMGSLILST